MNQSWINSIRKNHAAEHATIAILGSKLDMFGQFGGRSFSSGFFIYGPTSIDIVEAACNEALTRLKAGEYQLAISPFCGTNFLIAGGLTTLTSAVILGRRKRLGKIPEAVGAAVLGIMASFQIGSKVQRKWTTNPDIQNLSMVKIEEIQIGTYKISTIEKLPAK
jgi:hypothetical protein